MLRKRYIYGLETKVAISLDHHVRNFTQPKLTNVSSFNDLVEIHWKLLRLVPSSSETLFSNNGTTQKLCNSVLLQKLSTLTWLWHNLVSPGKTNRQIFWKIHDYISNPSLVRRCLAVESDPNTFIIIVAINNSVSSNDDGKQAIASRTRDCQFQDHQSRKHSNSILHGR